jgi:hypothetical protein
MTEEITPEELFRLIKSGNPWNAKKIKDALEELIESYKSNITMGHIFAFDTEDQFYYLHDNNCYLFVYDEEIETRSDRTDVLNEGLTAKFPITDMLNIKDAYNHFCGITLEPKIR